MATTLDASAATFKIPLQLFDMPEASSGGGMKRQNATGAADSDEVNVPAVHRRKRQGRYFEPPVSGYREYLLFALRTRITPDLQNLVGRSVIVSYTGYPAPSMRLSMPGGDTAKEPHINEVLRQEITDLLTREALLPWYRRLECLILRWNSVRYLTSTASSASDGSVYERIPARWLRSVIPFIPHDSSLLFKADQIPRVEHRDGGLYADCLHTAPSVSGNIEELDPYKQLFNRMSILLITLIRRWYDEGRIVDPEQSLVKRWKLEPVKTLDDTTTMFQPQSEATSGWGLSRLSRGTLLNLPVSALLYDLAKGRERSVSVRVGVNLVNYHEISKKLFNGTIGSPYHFAAGLLHFVPRDLEDLLRVLDGVDQVLYGDSPGSGGAVVTLTASRLSWIRVYALVIQRAVSSDIAIYVRRDIEPVFVISFKVPIDTNVAVIRQEVVLRARRLLVYLIDKLKTDDIHSAMDSSTTELPSDLSSPTVRSHLAQRYPDMPLDTTTIKF